jgi:chaperone required for assembly of F1-ATPase
VKRFYKTVSVAGDHSVLLDGKPVLTPAKRRLMAPTLQLADAIAQEWREQGDDIAPATMLLTKLANTAIDRNETEREALVEELTDFGGHDLLCYRAAEADELRARQQAAWDPLLDWADKALGARLAITHGVGHIEQDAQAISVLMDTLQTQNVWTLTGLHAATTITGSLVLALAIARQRLSSAEAFVLSRIDETFQGENWGLDAQAEARARRLAAELEAAGRFMALANLDMTRP